MVDFPEGSEDEEEPLPEDLGFKRSWKDKLKLFVLPPLYFLFMMVAAVVAFFSIDALIQSYRHKVRSIRDITVDHYRIIGIAMFPGNLATFHSCDFLYVDSLYSDEDKWDELHPPNQICEYKNVTYFSDLLNHNRTAMVFNGPTLVHKKQNLALHFTVETDGEDYSAIEYFLLGYWDQVVNTTAEQQAKYLAEVDQQKPLFSAPAGFRTWIKMSYTVYNHGLANKNISDFSVYSDLAAFNGRKNGSVPLVVLFEWKDDTYEYVTEILSTNVWNTVGSLAGVFVALIKVGEYSNRWIKRMRRERKKKHLKAAEIEEQHHKKLDLYWRKKFERRLKDLESRLES